MIGWQRVLQVGQTVGGYELIANLRVGGMATLFLARQFGAAGFSRIVAIKAVHPALANDDQFRQMLIDEAMLAARIHHPNVAHIETLGEFEGAPFLVMEYVHGCSLSQLQRALVSRGRRLAPAFATRIAMLVADALHAAHEVRDEQGRVLDAVHRDVSPENVLLSYAGHVKLIDFGIAKAYGRRHKTREGMIKGKFRYMAPEQAHAKQVDRRADIYQLGILLWELLTLRRLFDAENDVDLLAQVREPTVLAPSALVHGIPAALDAAVLAALQRDPQLRPATAQQFSRMLGRAIPGAHEVDVAELSALAIGVMREQRAQERSSLPHDVVERLDREIPTAPLFGEASAPSALEQRSTIEHNGDQQLGYARQSVSTAPGFSSIRPDSRSSRPVTPEAREPRARRLVRMASELSTTWTRIAHEASRHSKSLWLGAGLMLALGGTLVAVLWLRLPATRQRPPPPVPTMPLPLLGTASPKRSSTDQPATEESATQKSVTKDPDPIRAHENGRSGAPAANKLAQPRVIDGTPLIPEPGF